MRKTPLMVRRGIALLAMSGALAGAGALATAGSGSVSAKGSAWAGKATVPLTTTAKTTYLQPRHWSWD